MGKQAGNLAIYILFGLTLAACSSQDAQIVEVTRIVPQTVEVTPKAMDAIPEPDMTATPQPTPLLDRKYYDGVILITQYYTFLGNSLYEEAYQLLGSSAKVHAPDPEDYVTDCQRWFQEVEIVSIQPFTVWSQQHGGPPRQDSEDQIYFAVEIRAWGEGRMSGSAVSGELQLLFLGLVIEDGAWKIDSFATALTP